MSVYNEIYNEAFNDELEKVAAIHPAIKVLGGLALAGGLGAGLGALAGRDIDTDDVEDLYLPKDYTFRPKHIKVMEPVLKREQRKTLGRRRPVLTGAATLGLWPELSRGSVAKKAYTAVKRSDPDYAERVRDAITLQDQLEVQKEMATNQRLQLINSALDRIGRDY